MFIETPSVSETGIQWSETKSKKLDARAKVDFQKCNATFARQKYHEKKFLSQASTATFDVALPIRVSSLVLKKEIAASLRHLIPS
jgi:hypothetical protein